MGGFINEHGTKLYGGLTAFFGTLQALITTGSFDKLMSEAGVGWMGIVAALSTAVLGSMTMARGFNNTTQAKVAQVFENALNAEPPRQAGFARLSMLAFIAAIATAVLLSACGGSKAVYEIADTPPQYAKAVLLHHNAIGEQIVSLRADPAVSEASKTKLLDLYRQTVCSDTERQAATATSACADGPAQSLDAAAKAYDTLRSAKTEAELQRSVDALVGLLVNIINVVSEAK